MLPVVVQIAVVAVFGLIMGSFATALAWRIPREEKWTGRERSRCSSCGTVLTGRDLVPLFSWILHRGKCRHCAAPVSASYPLTELAALGAALGFYAAWGWGPALFFLMAAVPFLLAHIVIDARHMILPDTINLILAVIFLLFGVYLSLTPAPDYTALWTTLAAGPLYAGLIAAVGFVMARVLKKDTLGGGDVKFFAVAGWGLGLSYLPVFLMLSGVFGVACGLFWRLRFKKDVFPFGPAIILGFYTALLLRGCGWAIMGGAY